nr:hypothetical protein [Tanacetum cinerariifolium]
NVAFVSSNNTSSTNETVNTAHSVFAANFKNQASTTSYANDIMFSFFSNQSSALQFDNEDLEQIDTNDLEDMDFKWQVAMLTMRVKRFIKNTGRRLDLNRKDTVGFDRTKVKCYNFHRRSHFAKECRAPRNKRNKNRNAPTRNAPVDTSTTNDLVVQDGIDLEQIDTDDLEEMDLKWQVAMLTMRVKRFIKKTERKLDLNGKDTVGFDKTKVECYNYHRRGHFAKECRAPRNHGNRNKDAPTRNAPVNTPTTNALVVQDGIGGYDWSFQAEEELTKFSLMAHISSSSSSDFKVHTCSKECLKFYDALQKQYDQQRKALNRSNLEIIDKTGLGYECHVNESELLNNTIDSCEIDGDDNQVNDRFKKGKGYHAVPPPYTGNYMPPRADLSFAGLDNSVFKYKESDSEDENVFEPKEVKKTVKPSLEKIEFVNARNTTVENKNKAKRPRKFSQSPRANTYNFNEKVNTAKVNNVTTAGPKAVVSAAEGNRNNAIKSLACWIWRPKGNLIDHISKDIGSYTLKRFNYVDPQGRLKHITGNKSCLIDYQEIDDGFVVFGGNAKGGLKSSEDEVAGKKSTEVPRKEDGVHDLTKEGEAANTNSTNRLNIVSSPVNVVSSSFTTVDPGRERTHMNEFKSMFRQDKDANGNMIFTHVSVVGSTYVNLGGSIHVNVATLPNADLHIDPLMPDLEDIVDLQDTEIFSGAYDDEVEGAVADFNNLELTTVVSPIPTTRIHKDHPQACKQRFQLCLIP